MNKQTFILFLCIFICNGIIAQTTPGDGVKALKTGIETLKKDASLKNASWSICVQKVSDGSTLAEYNSDISLVPASAMKAITTATALNLLGAKFVFETRIEYSGTLDTNGTLYGNIYISGGGDPTLGSGRFGVECSQDSIFGKFFTAIRTAGIKSVEGNIVADASIFDDNMAVPSWNWEDIGNYYASGSSGLNIHENYYRVYFDAGAAVGDPATVGHIEPPMYDIEFYNFVTTAKAGTGDQVIIYGSPYTYMRIMQGTVPLGKSNFDVDGSIPDPPMYCVKQFRSFIENKGIIVSGTEINSRMDKWKGISDTNKRTVLSTHKSPPLSKIVYYTNRNSVNMFAETILKMIGYKQTGIGSTDAGTIQVNTLWKSKGVEMRGFEMMDGSGLSRRNVATTKQFCNILRIFKSDPAFSSFEESLPVAGKSGGLAGMFTGTSAEGNLKAKTGTMTGVRSFVGYVSNQAGDELTFAVISNNFTCKSTEMRNKLENLMVLIASSY